MPEPVSIPVPDKIESLLDKLDQLEKRWNARELLDQILALLADLDKALSDGNLSVWEVLALGRRLVRIAKTTRRA